MATATATKKPAAKKPAAAKKATAKKPAAAKKATAKKPAAANRPATLYLDDLVPSPKNVRRYKSTAGLEQFAANIGSFGIINNLVVEPNDKGKFEVVAGSRRLAALNLLKKEGKTVKGQPVEEYPIPVAFREDGASATEISLSENQERADMDPLEAALAFQRMIDEGLSAEEIGDRFGISHMTVRRRLALANLSPKIQAEYEKGEATLDVLQALAVTTDHKQQEEVFFSLPEYQRSPHYIKQALTTGSVPSTDPRARLVGVDAYLEAGGTITEDLFSENGVSYFDDVPLLIKLAAQRMNMLLESEVDREGWKWVDITLDSWPGHEFDRIYEVDSPPSEEDQARLDDLQEQLEQIDEAYHATDDPDEEEALRKQADKLTEEIDAIHENYSDFDPVEKSYAGVMLCLQHDGTVKAHSGLVARKDQTALIAKKEYAKKTGQTPEPLGAGEEPEVEEKEEPAKFTQALASDLLAYKTLCLQNACNNGERGHMGALVALAYSMTLHKFYDDAYTVGNCLTFNAARPYKAISTLDPDNIRAQITADETFEAYKKHLPDNVGDLWDWLIKADIKEVIALIAYCTGFSIAAYGNTYETNLTRRNQHVDQVAEVLGLDMADYWEASEGFFNRISKEQILAACRETGQSEDFMKKLSKMKKCEMAKAAAVQLKGSGWLPEPLRRQSAD